MSARWRVPLPRGAELHFHEPLEKERLGVGRWTAMFFGLFGSYGKNDSVDVQYRLGGRETVATGLEIIAPNEAGTPSPDKP